MGNIEPIISEDNYDIIRGAVDLVMDYHSIRQYPTLVYCDTRSVDFPRFLSERVIPVYVKTDNDASDGIEYCYEVVLSEDTGEYLMSYDPFVQ